jgi:hypothetical protein
LSNATPRPALNIIDALIAFNAAGRDPVAAMLASGILDIKPSPQVAFALDQACLKHCHFPRSGAPGDGVGDLLGVFRVLFGLEPIGGDGCDCKSPLTAAVHAVSMSAIMQEKFGDKDKQFII